MLRNVLLEGSVGSFRSAGGGGEWEEDENNTVEILNALGVR